MSVSVGAPSCPRRFCQCWQVCVQTLLARVDVRAPSFHHSVVVLFPLPSVCRWDVNVTTSLFHTLPASMSETQCTALMTLAAAARTVPHLLQLLSPAMLAGVGVATGDDAIASKSDRSAAFDRETPNMFSIDLSMGNKKVCAACAC